MVGRDGVQRDSLDVDSDKKGESQARRSDATPAENSFLQVGASYCKQVQVGASAAGRFPRSRQRNAQDIRGTRSERSDRLKPQFQTFLYMSDARANHTPGFQVRRPGSADVSVLFASLRFSVGPFRSFSQRNFLDEFSFLRALASWQHPSPCFFANVHLAEILSLKFPLVPLRSLRCR